MDQQQQNQVTSQADVDLGEFEDALEGKVVIKHPKTGEATPNYVVVMGPEHPKRKKMVMDKQREARRKFQRTGKMTFQDPLEEYEDQTEMLAACTLEWHIVLGGVIPFSTENAMKLYADPTRQWLRAQVATGFDERELFIKTSAGS